MNCTICHRPAPDDPDQMIDGGWIPDYYCGQSHMPGPVCPECCEKYLRFGKDGEWETIAPPADGYRWN